MRQYRPLEKIPTNNVPAIPALARNLEIVYTLLQEVNDRVSDVRARLDNHNIRGAS